MEAELAKSRSDWYAEQEKKASPQQRVALVVMAVAVFIVACVAVAAFTACCLVASDVIIAASNVALPLRLIIAVTPFR